MTFDAYVAGLFESLDIDWWDNRQPSDELYSEIGLDSMQAFEVVLYSEEMAGLRFPPAEIPMIFTLGEAYSYYCLAVEIVAAAKDEGVQRG